MNFEVSPHSSSHLGMMNWSNLSEASLLYINTFVAESFKKAIVDYTPQHLLLKTACHWPVASKGV